MINTVLNLIDHIKNNNIVKLFWTKIPDQLRPGYRAYNRFRRLIKQKEFESKEKIREFQFVKLKQIVCYAWDNVQGYRELWERANFHPNRLKNIEDIQLIPFVTKELIRENLSKFSNSKIKMRIYSTTGGSTGAPLGFYLEPNNIFAEIAFIHDMWSRQFAGTSRLTRSTILRGDNVGKNGYIHTAKALVLSSYDINLANVKKYIRLIERFKSPLFQAYPSAIHLMAKIMKDKELKLNHKFSAIMLGSEPLYAFQRSLIEKVFGAKISHWYGATELVVLAGNCEVDDRFHVYPQYGITEIIKNDGTLAKEGEVGEIVGTSFWNFATPFIRYRTKDYAELGASSCERCGRQYDLLNKIEGRLHDYIVDREKCLISLTALIFAQHFKAFGNINQMSLYQDKIGEVVVNISPTSNFSKKDELEIKETMENAAYNKIDVRVKYNENIRLSQSGKFRFMDQKLDLDDFIK